MSFQQGLSGLNAAAKSLEVIGNNVSNANTVGFKQSAAKFADVYANSLSGSGGTQIGIGVKVAQVQQAFTQGNITSTNNPLDIAINGGGFFAMNSNGATTYSRNGQFQLDKNGFIVNAEGKQLMGYTATSPNKPIELRINTAELPPNATSSIQGTMNFDSRSSALVSANFSPSDPLSYHHSTAVNVFDSLGNSHLLQSYFVKTAPGEWDVFTSLDGATIGYTAPATPVATAQMSFGPSGVTPTITPALPSITAPVTTGAADINLTIDYSNNTQFGSNFAVTNLAQDGFTSGRLAGFNVGNDGTIIGRYSNGQTNSLGQVALINFNNPNGLQPLGGNAWAESADSGPAIDGKPNSGNLGTLQSLAVEDSNVDLTAELVNMITAQRFYQANAQTIKTQDQVLQTLVNLR